jgi:hypothetical protein
MTANTWEARDLPVLRAIVEMSDEGVWHVEPDQIAERTDLGAETVQVALWALACEDPPFFDYINLSGLNDKAIGGIQNPTGHARRTVGTWPKPEDRIEQMIAVLREVAEREPDPKQKSILRMAAEYVAGIPRDVAVGIAIAMATGDR